MAIREHVHVLSFMSNKPATNKNCTVLEKIGVILLI